MGIMQVNVDADAEVADISMMRDMSAQEYAGYIDGSLMWVDHHDILRSTIGEYPIATSSKQVEALISYLQKVAAQMKEAEG